MQASFHDKLRQQQREANRTLDAAREAWKKERKAHNSLVYSNFTSNLAISSLQAEIKRLMQVLT